ncbi:pancreatic alpha-amylase-like [Anneissia japonica]|uniref:pancreatic alpha-amylase-like n=1 Tax=Anneissia japonica TaxID=1529436 RepID=UPI0014258152|nr:pancreatic alpha-amylase-like [Anneissia japonica]
MKFLIAFWALIGLSLAQWDPQVSNGQAIVHLFEWTWADIADECERWLGPNGFGGVQISPPNEHAVITSPSYPWWQRYQPVSYKLGSRSGTEAEFVDMVTRCNNKGVHIYVDAVINHMSAQSSGVGSDGSSFSASSLSFPAVPYSSLDFNLACSINDYNDQNQVRNCRLVGLPDLALGKEYVRGKIVDFMNTLIGYGVAGFRVDACKHMWPGDLQIIYDRLDDLNTKWFKRYSRPFIFQEVIDQGGEAIKATDYTGLGRVTEFNYGLKLGDCFVGEDKLKYLSNFGEAWGLMNDGSALVFIDNHDNQRGHGGGGHVLTHESPKSYKLANAFMLAWPYGFPRIMSSYFFSGTDEGPPSSYKGQTKSVTINSDNTCGNGWVCEHRWRQIKNMVKFRNVAEGTDVNNWWDNDNQAIAFSRGNKAFLVINNDSYRIKEWLSTGLPAGTYCDVISGDYTGSKCTGPTITVYADGRAYFDISNSSDDPMIAIHVDARL